MTTDNDLVGLGVDLSVVSTLPTMALKASLGIWSLCLDRPWAEASFLTEDQIRIACGMDPATAKKHAPELPLVRMVSTGSSWTGNAPPQASEWKADLLEPATSPVSWPKVLKPSHPIWHAKSSTDCPSSLGHNGWRVCLVVLNLGGFSNYVVTVEQLLALTGLERQALGRTIKKLAMAGLLTQIVKGTYRFNPHRLSELDQPAPAVEITQRSKDRAAFVANHKAAQNEDEGGVWGVGDMSRTLIREQAPSDDPEEYVSRRTAAEALFEAKAQANAQIDKRRIRPQADCTTNP